MKQGKNTKLSLYTFIFLSVAVVFSRFLLPRFQTHDVLAILSWDVFGYYLYLPATFIYHDLGLKDFSWVQHILDTYRPTFGFYQAYLGPVGDYVLKYPMGLAILNAPFFFTGHFFAWMLGFPRDGFSMPYQVAVSMGGLVYSIAGIGILRKVLLHFFRDRIVAFTLVLIVLGTNYFQLTAYDGAMPHNYLFTLYALIVWLTIRWHESPKIRDAIFLGTAIGLAVLARPTCAVIILVPLLWGIIDKDSLKRKWDLVRTHVLQILLLILFLAGVTFFQMIYWKIHGGSFFYYSYESTEKLQWIAPYLWQVLFSFKKGWLVYAPMMIFPVIGFYFLAEKNKRLFFPVFIFFLVNILIIASWPTWWYGGSLGQRTMMESYAILAIPLGYFLRRLVTWNPFIKFPVYIVFLFFILLNLFQTWQYMNFIIDPSNMTRKYYQAVFGRTSATEESKQLLEGYEVSASGILENRKKFSVRVLSDFDFENEDFPYKGNLVSDIVKNGRFAFRMDTGMTFSPGLNSSFADLGEKSLLGLRVTAWVYSSAPFSKNPANLVITCNHAGMNYHYKAIFLEQENLGPGEWHKLTMYYLAPASPDPQDRLQVYFWFRGKKEMYVDDLKTELFEPIE